MMALCVSIAMLDAQTLKTVPGMYGTIADAISAASSGDTISIGPNTYYEEIHISKNLTLIGAGINLTKIHGLPGVAEDPDSAAMYIDNATVKIRDIQFLGGANMQSGRRGLIAINSNTTVRNCAFVQLYNVAIADVNGILDLDTVIVTTYNSGGAVVVDSAGPSQSVLGGFDLGVMLVNSQFTIDHLTGGAKIDHIIDIYADMTGNTMLGHWYPVDTTHGAVGTIQNSTFFGSRQGYYGQGIRIGGGMTRIPANLIIRNNRFKGTVTDSTLADPDYPTTAGISFNGYNGYAEIYGNSITQFNSGIAFHGIATASMHDNTITGNARYGVVTTDPIYPVTPPDLGGGAFGSPGRNTIMNNGHYNVLNRNAAVHYAQNNYWGTTDPAAIDAGICDDNENAGYGLVHFENYASTSNVLPVELTSFTTSHVSAHQVVLHWRTATELNNAGFDVERRNSGGDAQAWRRLGFVAGAGTSNAPREYGYADATVSAGRYEYRLKQIDRDGRWEYSKVIEAEAGAVPNVFELSQNYPNPFNPSTTLSFTVPSDGYASLKVYTALGQQAALVYEGGVQAGVRHDVTFDASGLASGVYFARLEFNGRQLMRKITLMK
jgi:hypothetical protein